MQNPAVRNRIDVRLFAAVALACTCGVARGTVVVFNSSFEQPVAAGILEDPSAAAQGAGPGDSPWVGTGSAGIAASKTITGQTVVPIAPDGKQVGFVDVGGSLSQILIFPKAGQYQLNYQEAGIGIYAVLLDSTTINASHLTPGSFTSVGIPFSAEAGTHTLTFQDTDPREIAGPLPAFIDAVSVVPEPTGIVPIAAAGLLAARRRKREES